MNDTLEKLELIQEQAQQKITATKMGEAFAEMLIDDSPVNIRKNLTAVYFDYMRLAAQAEARDFKFISTAIYDLELIINILDN